MLEVIGFLGIILIIVLTITFVFAVLITIFKNIIYGFRYFMMDEELMNKKNDKEFFY